MDRGIPLFKVNGIQIRMHYTFPLILVFAAVQFAMITGRGLTGALFGVIVTSILFAIVVLHELGHSFAAQHYGIQVKQIVLLPIGGLAQLARMPEKPSQELVISAAGPLVNFTLARGAGRVRPDLRSGTWPAVCIQAPCGNHTWERFSATSSPQTCS